MAELVGFENLDLVTELLEKREAVKQAVSSLDSPLLAGNQTHQISRYLSQEHSKTTWNGVPSVVEPSGVIFSADSPFLLIVDIK